MRVNAEEAAGARECPDAAKSGAGFGGGGDETDEVTVPRCGRSGQILPPDGQQQRDPGLVAAVEAADEQGTSPEERRIYEVRFWTRVARCSGGRSPTIHRTTWNLSE